MGISLATESGVSNTTITRQNDKDQKNNYGVETGKEEDKIWKCETEFKSALVGSQEDLPSL